MIMIIIILIMAIFPVSMAKIDYSTSILDVPVQIQKCQHNRKNQAHHSLCSNVNTYFHYEMEELHSSVVVLHCRAARALEVKKTITSGTP